MMLDCPGSFLGQDNFVYGGNGWLTFGLYIVKQLESGEMAEPADKIAMSDFQHCSTATLARSVNRQDSPE